MANTIKYFFLFLLLAYSTSLQAQVEDDPDADEKENKPLIEFNSEDYKGFSVGVNFGVHFANKSAATFYTGNDFFHA